MKLLLLILLPFSVLAQTNEDILNEMVTLLKVNQEPTPLWNRLRRESSPDTVTRNARYYWYQGQRFAFNHQFEQAMARFERGSQLDPKPPGFVGVTFLNQFQDYPRAIQYLDAYDALTPDFDDMEGNSPVSYWRGLAFQKSGDHPQALRQFAKAIDSLEHKHGAKWVNYRFYINRAVSYLAIRQPAQALIDLDKAVKNFGRSPLAQYYRGRALVALNRPTEARTAYQDALFFVKDLRAERGTYREDEYNSICETEIEAALAELP